MDEALNQTMIENAVHAIEDSSMCLCKSIEGHQPPHTGRTASIDWTPVITAAALIFPPDAPPRSLEVRFDSIATVPRERDRQVRGHRYSLWDRQNTELLIRGDSFLNMADAQKSLQNMVTAAVRQAEQGNLMIGYFPIRHANLFEFPPVLCTACKKSKPPANWSSISVQRKRSNNVVDSIRYDLPVISEEQNAEPSLSLSHAAMTNFRSQWGRATRGVYAHVSSATPNIHVERLATSVPADPQASHSFAKVLNTLPDIPPGFLDHCWCRSYFTWELEDTYPDLGPFDTSLALTCAAQIFGSPHRSDKIVVKHMWRTEYEYDELADDEWMPYYSALVEEDFGGGKGNDMTLLVGDKVATWKLADACLVAVAQAAVQKFSLGWIGPEMKSKLPILPEHVGFDKTCSYCGKSTI